jgi:putative sterol carrier protein
MPAFLSDAWIAALDEAARSDDRLRELTADLALVIEQRVTPEHLDAAAGSSGEDADDDAVYHLRFDHGTVRVAAGPAAAPDLRFRQDRETAREIAAGQLSAQRAFMAGRLQVGGDLRALVDHGPVLAALHDAFAGVRALTTDLETAPADHP